MGKITKSLEELVGNTPLFEPVGYERKNNLQGNILVKLEWFNASGSIKARAALNMINEAEKEGKLHPGDTIVEATSGNTGIALATFGAARGYKFKAFLEDGSSQERFDILRAYGAEPALQSEIPSIKALMDKGELSMEGIIEGVRNYSEEHGYFFINQMENPHNPEGHYRTTGPEIWEQTDGRVDIYVAMAGTGGTLLGTAKYLKEKNPNLKVVGVQADEASRIGSGSGQDAIDGVAPFHNVPTRFTTPFMLGADKQFDEIIEVSYLTASDTAKELLTTDGLFLGSSAAGAFTAARVLAERPENKGKNIVVIAPDDGTKYMSLQLYK